MPESNSRQSCNPAEGCKTAHRPRPDENAGQITAGTPAPSRRSLLARGGKLLAYTAPLVLLYKPRAAFATFIPYSEG